MSVAVRDDPWDGSAERGGDEPTLVVDVGGFEGPLDLLLDLARRQKVDLHEISILALADQYLLFVEEARSLRLELAADYLVMAAWLAFLKSRLLLPDPPRAEGPSAASLATALADRLRRLEGIRDAARRLDERPRLGRDVFGRGRDEPATDAGAEAPGPPEAGLYDLLSAYARLRGRRRPSVVTVGARAVLSLAEARGALEAALGEITGWLSLDGCLGPVRSDLRRSARASVFAASLELVREGVAEIDQDDLFAPLRIRARSRLDAAA